MTDNLRIWKQVERTNPSYTKQINQRGGFTAISANYQILSATEQFGPIGIGWGYTTGDPIIVETLVMVPVTLWHGERANTFGPMLGCEEWKSSNGRIDSDAPKKAVTDGITKLLSQLGFNADVFLGKFDDQKYVAQMRKEFADVQQDAAEPKSQKRQPAKQEAGTPFDDPEPKPTPNLTKRESEMLDEIYEKRTPEALKEWLTFNQTEALASPNSERIIDAYNTHRAKLLQARKNPINAG